MSSTVIFPHATSHIIGGVIAVTTSMKSLVSTDGKTRKFGVKTLMRVIFPPSKGK